MLKTETNNGANLKLKTESFIVIYPRLVENKRISIYTLVDIFRKSLDKIIKMCDLAFQ